jgi:hypothetical protein
MLIFMHKLLALLTLLMAFPLYGAEIYKTYDQFGNPIFSDKATDEAEKIEVDDVMTIPAFRGPPPSGPRPEPVERYRQISITSPKNDETYFKAEGNLVISIQLIPRLFSSDSIVVNMDGQQIYSGKSTSFSLADVDRGIHTMDVSVVDAAGNELKRSDQITFYIRQASRLNVPN